MNKDKQNEEPTMSYTEANYANAVIYLLEQLGYTRYYGPTVLR